MNIKIKLCTTVGGAYMVISIGKYGKTKTVAIGLTDWEARALKKRLQR